MLEFYHGFVGLYFTETPSQERIHDGGLFKEISLGF
jgi:hypothetical protein